LTLADNAHACSLLDLYLPELDLAKVLEKDIVIREKKKR
jgi:hypothetical protein